MAPPEQVTLYRVVYSLAVEQQLLELSTEAVTRGDGAEFAAALKAFRERLAIYPQFGDPQIDLTTEVGVVYLGIIPPLCMRYGVLEDRRLVLCVALPTLLPRARPSAADGE